MFYHLFLGADCVDLAGVELLLVTILIFSPEGLQDAALLSDAELLSCDDYELTDLGVVKLCFSLLHGYIIAESQLNTRILLAYYSCSTDIVPQRGLLGAVRFC